MVVVCDITAVVGVGCYGRSNCMSDGVATAEGHPYTHTHTMMPPVPTTSSWIVSAALLPHQLHNIHAIRRSLSWVAITAILGELLRCDVRG